MLMHLESSSCGTELNHISDPHLSLLVKAQDIVAHTAGPATLHLVFVSEELLPGKTPPVVQLSVRQHSQQSALTSIHVTHDCNPKG